MENIIEQIKNMSHAYFDMHSPTPETINGFIDRMKGFFSEYDLDDKKLFNMLEEIHSPTIKGDAKILEDNNMHEEWFNPDTNLPLRGDFEWHFWKHYREYLIIKKKWPASIVNSVDRFSSLILSKLEDPKRDGVWDRRGMVVGNVQSGKTANYTSLITKATDAGYKLIVVLAGVHNSLRSQTQERINEEFLGYDLEIIQKITGQEKRFGVRRMFSDHRVVNTLTSSAVDGDFKRAIANQAGIIPSVTGDPIILIIKKHVTILKNLIGWATTLGVPDKKGRKIIQDIPLLVIDDECDYASVNTKKPERDEYGKIVDEWDPAKTNKCIRQLLSSFSKSIYIGYTATPYANIFIHKEDPHPKYGPDLFPKHFLVSLPQPTNYMGPELFFGLGRDPDAGIENVEPLPLVREVLDSFELIPNSHKSSLIIPYLPESLKESLKYFILVCAARGIRTMGTPHNTMLIHVTRFTQVQKQVYDFVDTELKTLTARIMSGTDNLDDFRLIWEQDFTDTSLTMKSRNFNDSIVHEWEDIKSKLYQSIRNIKIRGVNGDIGDTLDYRQAEFRTRERIERGESVPWIERGVSLIAIGGDKLSRGLTLDGLSVSYYLRSARMYDTLMQMGRWFGYRDGYNDLCRIFITGELIEWYRHIALANIELKNEFDYMETIGGSPENFGLKVRNHPGRLAITSAGKARATERMLITFAGRCLRTIVFDPRNNKNNIKALERLIQDIGKKTYKKMDFKKPRYHWENVSPVVVVDFLRSYKTQDEVRKVVDPDRIADYIEKQLPKDELLNWHVVIVSNTVNKAVHMANIGGLEVGTVQRTPLRKNAIDRISIGTLTSPSDEYIDIDKDELDELRMKFKAGDEEIEDQKFSAFVRQLRPSHTGLLLIYLPANRIVLSSDHTLNTYGLENDEVVGFAISFPGSETAEPIEYVVNSVYAEGEM